MHSSVCLGRDKRWNIISFSVLNFFWLLFYQINAYFVFVVDYRGSFRGRCLIKDEAQSICRIWNWLLSSERCCLYLKGGLEKSPEWLKREIIPLSCILVWNTWKSWSCIKSHLLLVPYFSQPFNCNCEVLGFFAPICNRS